MDSDGCNRIDFILDGKTYSAIEDPADGYRSALDKILVNVNQCTNVFTPIEVIGVWDVWDDPDTEKIINFIDVKNELINR